MYYFCDVHVTNFYHVINQIEETTTLFYYKSINSYTTLFEIKKPRSYHE